MLYITLVEVEKKHVVFGVDSDIIVPMESCVVFNVVEVCMSEVSSPIHATSGSVAFAIDFSYCCETRGIVSFAVTLDVGVIDTNSRSPEIKA